MHSYVVLDGTIYAVRDDELPVAAFKALLLAAVPSAKKPAIVHRSLSGLNFYEKPSRWYALYCLLDQQARVPLYASEADARASMQVAV